MKHISWTFAGNIIYSACQWAILSLIAKAGSSFMLGQFNLAMGIATPVFLFLSFQLRSVVTTDQKNEFSFNDYFQLRFLFSTIAFLIVSIIGFSLGYGFKFMLLLFGISLLKFLESLSDIIYGAFQQKEEFNLISKSLILRGITYIFFYFVGVFFFDSVITGVYFANLSLVIILYLDILKITGIELNLKKFNYTNLYTITKKSLPLGLVILIISLIENVPKYFIEYFIGTKELGIYTSIIYVTIVGSTIINAFGQASITRLTSYYLDKQLKLFLRLQLALFIFTFLIGIILYSASSLIGDDILVILYNKEFLGYDEEFKLVMLGALFQYLSSILGYGITAARYFKIQPVILTLVLIFNGLFCFLFIDKGVLGIALAYMVTGILNLICQITIFVYVSIKINKETDAYEKNPSHN